MFSMVRVTLLSITILFLYSCFAAMSMEFNSARSYARIEDNLEEAEKWALLALEKEPDNAQIPYFLAVEVYRPQKKYDRVGEMYKEALKRNSNLDLEQPFKSGGKVIKTVHGAIRNEAETIYNQGSSYYTKGKKKKAEKSFKMSMELNPNLIDNYLALSDLSYERDNIEGAIDYLDMGSKYDSKNFLIFVKKSIYLKELKEYDKAILTLQNIEINDADIQMTIDYEIFKLNMDKENYANAAALGSGVVENMFNSTSIDDAVLAEACYNVAICNRYLGYEGYNKAVDVINQGIDDKDVLSSTLEDAKSAIDYFKVAKERFYDASSFDPDDQKSANHAKDLNKLIKQLKKLFIPSIEDLLEQ